MQAAVMEKHVTPAKKDLEDVMILTRPVATAAPPSNSLLQANKSVLRALKIASNALMPITVVCAKLPIRSTLMENASSVTRVPTSTRL